jgi:hypothetical protein
MKGRLELADSGGGTATLEARVVRHRLPDQERISFHQSLRRYNGTTGRLTMDDGSVVNVTVHAPFLWVNPK